MSSWRSHDSSPLTELKLESEERNKPHFILSIIRFASVAKDQKVMMPSGSSIGRVTLTFQMVTALERGGG